MTKLTPCVTIIENKYAIRQEIAKCLLHAGYETVSGTRQQIENLVRQGLAPKPDLVFVNSDLWRDPVVSSNVERNFIGVPIRPYAVQICRNGMMVRHDEILNTANSVTQSGDKI